MPRTISIGPAQQLSIAKDIVHQNLQAAVILERIINSAVESGFQPIPSQNIKQEVEAVTSAIQVLAAVLDGKLVFS